MLNKQYYVEKAKVDRLVARKNTKADFYNGIYDRYEYPVLTREFAPVHWRYDLDEETNPYFMERLGINAVMNSGAIYLNGKYYLVVRVEGNDRKSFFAVAERILVSTALISGITRLCCRIPAQRKPTFMTCV